ncbi:YaaA family protein [Paraoerskovia marina]|uniref:YaaA family protein n=1 Tax=Paraoerskovia marina TaxID=545619 RepID=UPI0004923A37|nr:peroxide stress protein YaaA [Paraoerskovia marina]
MLVLLPPSEGKTAPTTGAPFTLEKLSHPTLNAHRRAVLDVLADVSARPDALELLGVGAGVASDVERNLHLDGAPTAPASSVYTGVLYAAAGLDALRPAAAERADRSVLTISALWGAVAPGDLIPAYRLSMGTLPGLGKLATAWRPHLSRALDGRAGGDVVVDCRSAPYAAAWKPPADADWVAVKVVREVAGVRKVVSHNAKHTRGVLTGHLLQRPGEPTSADELLKATEELVGTTVGTEVGSGLHYTLLEAGLSASGRGPRTLELLIS